MGKITIFVSSTFKDMDAERDMMENYVKPEIKKRLAAHNIMKDVDIVEYNYISDPEKTYHIGFIADDTDERIAGKAHDRMDTTNCIGVLIKAIQELSDKIARLEEKTNSNGGY